MAKIAHTVAYFHDDAVVVATKRVSRARISQKASRSSRQCCIKKRTAIRNTLAMQLLLTGSQEKNAITLDSSLLFLGRGSFETGTAPFVPLISFGCPPVSPSNSVKQEGATALPSACGVINEVGYGAA